MFNNNYGHNSNDTDIRLRKNLQTFNRSSLKILHPLFRDALRLIAHRHPNSKRETMLLPLVRYTPDLKADLQSEMDRGNSGQIYRAENTRPTSGFQFQH